MMLIIFPSFPLAQAYGGGPGKPMGKPQGSKPKNNPQSKPKGGKPKG